MPARFNIPAPQRRIVARFARVVCPPELVKNQLEEQLFDQLEPYLGAMPKHLQLGLMAAFTAFDQGARLWLPARGSRFVNLDDERADRYFRAMAHGPLSAQRSVCKLMKGLVTFNYYELPSVRAALEYHPDAYIAKVAKRRLETYAEAIRKGEEAVFADEPGQIVRLHRGAR